MQCDNLLNLEMTKGDSFYLGFEILDLGGTLNSAYFTIKQNFDDTTPLVQKSLSSGITLDHYSGTNYYYKVHLLHTDTDDLELGQYYYDLQITKNSDTYTILKGIFSLTFTVTGEVSSNAS